MIFDSNIFIYFLGGHKEVQKYFFMNNISISFISELEILSGPNLSLDSREKAEILTSKCNVIGYLPELKDILVGIRAQKNLKIADAIIAATAIYHETALISADKHFENIEGLDFIYHEPSLT